MKLSERQMKTLDNVKLNYGQLCNKRTLRSLERKGLIQWHISTGWSLTYLGVEALNMNINLTECILKKDPNTLLLL